MKLTTSKTVHPTKKMHRTNILGYFWALIFWIFPSTRHSFFWVISEKLKRETFISIPLWCGHVRGEYFQYVPRIHSSSKNFPLSLWLYDIEMKSVGWIVCEIVTLLCWKSDFEKGLITFITLAKKKFVDIVWQLHSSLTYFLISPKVE